jgi:hypothetical protein
MFNEVLEFIKLIYADGTPVDVRKKTTQAAFKEFLKGQPPVAILAIASMGNFKNPRCRKIEIGWSYYDSCSL